ncbi:hypothetical protein OAL35_00130 [bacterium]|nr:hypothetical protein [bacterium]
MPTAQTLNNDHFSPIDCLPNPMIAMTYPLKPIKLGGMKANSSEAAQVMAV